MDLWESGKKIFLAYKHQLVLGIATTSFWWVYSTRTKSPSPTPPASPSPSCPKHMWPAVEMAGILLCCMILWLIIYPVWRRVVKHRRDFKLKRGYVKL